MKKATLLQKDGAVGGTVEKRVASLLVEEGAAFQVNKYYSFYRLRYTAEELRSYVQQRDGKRCRHCRKATLGVVQLIGENRGGLETPVNMSCLCENCAEKGRETREAIRLQNMDREWDRFREEEEKENRQKQLRNQRKQLRESMTVHYESFADAPNRFASYDQLLTHVVRRKNLSIEDKPFTAMIRAAAPMLQLKEHALERWNERIGPHVNTREALEEKLQRLYGEPGRFSFISEDYCVLDDDIVLTYNIVDGVLHVTTFYGRISLQPALRDAAYIKRWKTWSNERLNLKVDADILAKQQFPLIADRMIHYTGVSSEYILELFHVEGKDHFFIFPIKTKRKMRRFEVVDPDDLKGFGKTIKKGIRYLQLLDC